MSTNGVVPKNQVIGAAASAISRPAAASPDGFRLTVLDERVYSSSGEWNMPVSVEGSAPCQTGHQLSRVLSQIQDDVGTSLHVGVTVVLEP